MTQLRHSYERERALGMVHAGMQYEDVANQFWLLNTGKKQGLRTVLDRQVPQLIHPREKSD